jgi:hypothetical protein
VSTHRYAIAGSIEQLAVAYRSLAAQAEMPIDEIIELAVADKLWIAARRAHERRHRSETIQKIMHTRAIKEPDSTRHGTYP